MGMAAVVLGSLVTGGVAGLLVGGALSLWTGGG